MNKKYLVGNNNFKLYVEEMVDAVNALDKTFGLKLKNPDIWNDPSQYIKIAIENSNLNIAALIVLINGINFSDYFETSTFDKLVPYKSIGTMHPLFNEDSLLKWNKENYKSEIDSLIFRARFVSNVLQYIMGSFDKIINNSVNYNKHSKDEYGIVNCRNYMNYIVEFSKIMIESDIQHKNIMLMMHEITSLKYKKVDHNRLKSMLNSSVINLRTNMKSNILVDRFYSDDIAIFEIIKIAFMLATNNDNVKCLPKFKYIENATVKHDLLKLIEALGQNIINNNGKNKHPLMFRAFINANPIVYTQFFNESCINENIKIGILALKYAKFVINDSIIDDFIDEMLRRGI